MWLDGFDKGIILFNIISWLITFFQDEVSFKFCDCDFLSQWFELKNQDVIFQLCKSIWQCLDNNNNTSFSVCI